MTYIELNDGNIEPYYYDWDGFVYYKADKIGAHDGKYWPAVKFDLEDMRDMLANGVQLIYVKGRKKQPFSTATLAA